LFKGERKPFCKRGHPRISENLDKKGNCKECKKIRQASLRLANFEKVKLGLLNSKLKLRYGITVERRNELISLQNNKCAICNFEFDCLTKARQPYIDHNHETG
jgi:hypothetical protein